MKSGILEFIENNKTKTVCLLFAIGISCLLIGVAYAFFNANVLGIRENQLVIGENLIFRYDETGDALSLTNDDIISDEEGKTKSKYFDFEITQETDVRAKTSYTIYLTKDPSSTLSDSNVKIYLTDQNNKEIKSITTIGALTLHETYANSFVLYETSIVTIEESKTDKYRLRVWIDESVSTTITEQDGVHSLETVDNTYKFTVNVELTGDTNDDDRNANAYALLLNNSDDESNPVPMIFVRENEAVSVGDIYDSETYGELEVTAVYSDFEDKNYYYNSNDDYLCPEWNESIQTITSVVIEDKIVPISTAGWFFGGFYINNIELQKLDTSNVTNMEYMFTLTVSLTLLDVSNFNTENVTNMSNMFSSCGTTELDVSNFNTLKVTDMSAMFSGLDGLTKLDVSNLNTSNVTNMSHMFSNLDSLTKLDVSKLDTSKVTNMSHMFSYLGNLTSLDVSKLDTSNVTDMSSMFANLNKLTKLDVSNFKTSNVTNMSAMFAYTSDLTELDLSNFDTSKVTNMSHMFGNLVDNDPQITSIDVSNFNTSKVTDMSDMFIGLEKLTELDLSSFNTENVTNMERMFEDNRKLTTIVLSNFNTHNVTNMNRMFYNCYVLTLDCSSWNVDKVTGYDYFIFDAPGVTPPTWPTTTTE